MSTRSHASWVAVACAEHVQRGRDGGFMQVCHGKAAPLRRVRPGDCVIYYSPTRSFRGGDTLQAFTAIGIVAAGEPYVADMGTGFRPARRDVTWLDARPAPIAPLIGALAFTGGRSWGMRLRAGLVAIEASDAALIAAAMGAALAVGGGIA
ncbi:MAG TPA: EVE domain-containing protein [Xanthobacteraceae bacterium]|nr:EVE domain-containing protein [Xanthobacteraceae bacterium]